MPIGKSWLMDYHLLFRGLGRGGVATDEPRRGRRVQILLWAITEVPAMIYIMNQDHPSPPSIGYLDTIERGYRAVGFHVRYLAEGSGGRCG